MRNLFKSIAPMLSLILVLGVVGANAAEMTTLPNGADFQILPAKHVVLSVTGIQADDSGLNISGQIVRHRFSPRHRLSGRVVAEVQSADGTVLETFQTKIMPASVTKGLRPSTFTFRMSKPLAEDSRLVLSFR